MIIIQCRQNGKAYEIWDEPNAPQTLEAAERWITARTQEEGGRFGYRIVELVKDWGGEPQVRLEANANDVAEVIHSHAIIWGTALSIATLLLRTFNVTRKDS